MLVSRFCYPAIFSITNLERITPVLQKYFFYFSGSTPEVVTTSSLTNIIKHWKTFQWGMHTKIIPTHRPVLDCWTLSPSSPASPLSPFTLTLFAPTVLPASGLSLLCGCAFPSSCSSLLTLAPPGGRTLSGQSNLGLPWMNCRNTFCKEL